LLLSLQLGFFGFDRFYLGRIGTGLLKLVTLGGLGIWWFVDLLRLMYGKTTDMEGRSLHGQELRHPTILIYLSAAGGFLGMDRFFLGQTGLGVAKLLTLGGLGVWWLVDLYLVLNGRLTDARGRPIRAEQTRYQAVALLLSVFAGGFGLDRHYLGHRSLAMLKLFTFAAAGLWYVLDVILFILNALDDVDGNPLVQE
jgi:TM2 domain-containing membrane protein YozV